MADNQGEYKIGLKVEADLKDAKALDNQIKETTVSVKGLEDAIKSLAKVQKETGTVPHSGNPNSFLASSGSKSPEQLRALEKASGLATERSMRAEDDALFREAAIQKQRRDAFMKSGSQNSESEETKKLGNEVGSLAGKYFTLYQAWRQVKNGFLETVEAFAEQEQSINKVGAALVQNGTYTEGYLAHLKNLAVVMQKATGIAQSDWLNTLGKLSQFGADASNIDSYATAVKNLTGIYGNTESATMALQKALEGNFTTFRRHGIYINENASQAEKLKSLFEQLAIIGGGQLEASMQGLSGAWKELTANGKDFGVQIGRFISNSFSLENIVRQVGYAFGFYADKLRIVSVEQGKANLAGERHVESLHAQKDAAEELREKMEKIRAQFHLTIEQINGMASAYDHLESAQQTTDDKKKEKELAVIKSFVEHRFLTEQEGIIRKAQVEEKYDRIAEARKERAIQRGIAEKDAELAASVAQEALLSGQIGQVQGRQVTRATEEEQRNKSQQATAKYQGIQKNLDEVNASLIERRSMFNGGGLMLQGPERFDAEARKIQLESEAKYAKKEAEEEARKTVSISQRANDDEKQIEQLKAEKNKQEQETQKKRFEAFNKANIGQIEIGELRNQRTEAAQTRRIETTDSLYQSRGGAAAVHASPAEEMRALEAERNANQIDFSKALRERNEADGRRDILLAKILGVNAQTVSAMERAEAQVEVLNRRLANRNLPGN